MFGLSTREHAVHALARQVGIVFQNPSAQLFHGQVENEVAFAPKSIALPVEELSRLALASTGMSSFGGRSPASLSLGEQQRTALVAVLAASPPPARSRRNQESMKRGWT